MSEDKTIAVLDQAAKNFDRVGYYLEKSKIQWNSSEAQSAVHNVFSLCQRYALEVEDELRRLGVQPTRIEKDDQSIPTRTPDLSGVKEKLEAIKGASGVTVKIWGLASDALALLEEGSDANT